MDIITDTEGFIKPVAFLGVSLFIMAVTYKNKTKWVWLSIVPIVVMFFYRGQIEDVLLEKEQQEYIITSWTDTYQPLSVQAKPNKKGQTELFDEWLVQTDGGEYLVRFNQGTSTGYEIYEVLTETEPLHLRSNVLSTLHTLGINGVPIFDERKLEYIINTEENEYVVTTNEVGRVDEVIDDSGALIYKNEEHLPDEEGRPLKEEEVG